MLLLTFLLLVLAATIMAKGLWPFDVGMLGHISGTLAGFLVTVIARRAGKYEPRTRSGREECTVTVILVFLLLVTLFVVSELNNMYL